MDFRRRDWNNLRYAGLAFGLIAALAFCRGIASAQESAELIGDHVSSAASAPIDDDLNRS